MFARKSHGKPRNDFPFGDVNTMRIVQLAVFLAVTSALTFAIHRYLFVRLVRDPEWSTALTSLGTWAMVLLGASMPLSMMLGRFLPRSVQSPIAWVVFTWMGLMFFLLIATGVSDAVRSVVSLVTGAPDAERRRTLARILAGAVGLFGTLTAAYATRTALAPWKVRTVHVKVKGLAPTMEGTVIVQLTDVHVGPTIGRDFIASMVREVNALSPDVIAITGDLVDGSVSSLGHHVAPLGELRAKHGVFFVTGNHEYYSGVEDWLTELRRLGVRVLANEHVTLDGVLDLAGVNDWSARRYDASHAADMGKALAGRDTSRPVVLLAHQPKHMREATERGVSLVLSGHTHGGQIWPWSELVALDQHYLAGLYREGDTQLYVSEGTGYWGPPMRINTSPEITKIVLERA
jgi:uncharacterized protein